MYRSDKKLTEDLFIPFQLLMIALESVRGDEGERLARIIKEEVRKYVSQFKSEADSVKFIKRCARISQEVLLDVADKQKVSGHKFVLVLHHLTELMISEDYDVQPFVVELFEPFLEIEMEQNKISDEEWLALKKSAEKQARKILLKLKTLNYFL